LSGQSASVVQPSTGGTHSPFTLQCWPGRQSLSSSQLFPGGTQWPLDGLQCSPAAQSESLVQGASHTPLLQISPAAQSLSRTQPLGSVVVTGTVVVVTRSVVVGAGTVVVVGPTVVEVGSTQSPVSTSHTRPNAQSSSLVQPLFLGSSQSPVSVLQTLPAAQSESLVQPPGMQLPVAVSQIRPFGQSLSSVQPVGGGV
jgi:hypothetical protein